MTYEDSHFFRPASLWATLLCCLLLIVAGCGTEDPGTEQQQNQSSNDGEDVGVNDDANGANADANDGDDPDANDNNDSNDNNDNNDTPSEAPEALDDYLICESDLDCPINGSECVDTVAFNRSDGDGTNSMAAHEIFDELAEGEGVCSQNCAGDPTVCQDVFWEDSSGEVHPSTCQLVVTGQAPYEIIAEDPFEVDIDEDDMERGQAFGAICRPPIGTQDDQGPAFCGSCQVGDDCGDERLCYNTLTEEQRDSVDELGASFCLDSCDDGEGCPMGFDCQTLEDEGDDAYCMPVEDTCTDCIDRDQNNVGTGHCGDDDALETAYDCDDRNPQAYYDPDDMEHPFPDHCYDDEAEDGDQIYNDLNCSGILDSEEQIGADNFGAEHCSYCGDECSGDVDGGVLECQTDEQGEPYCGVGCQSGQAVCDGNPLDGCPINTTEEINDADNAYFYDYYVEYAGEYDPEELNLVAGSPYIWFDAENSGDQWAAGDAEAHFFCDEAAAQAVLDNPVRRRGCVDGNPDANPTTPQTCSNLDLNCNGTVGTESVFEVGSFDGQSNAIIGDDCSNVEGEQGMCALGTIQCGGSGTPEVYCEAESNSDYPVTTPTCSGQDTTCSGAPDYEHDGEFQVDSGEGPIEVFTNYDSSMGDNMETWITEFDEDSPVMTASTVEQGTPCRVDGAKGQCAIGIVTCNGTGGLHCQPQNEPEQEQPGFDGIDHSCDGFDRYKNGDDYHIQYVSQGDSSPDLDEAIADAQNCTGVVIDGQQIPCDVFVQDVDNFEVDDTLDIWNGLHIYGGLSDKEWEEDDFQGPDYSGISDSSTVEVDANVGLRAVDITERTVIYGLTVETTDVPASGCEANIGMICDQCDELRLRRFSVQAGAGADAGSDGSDGVFPGQQGFPGQIVLSGSTSGLGADGGPGYYDGGRVEDFVAYDGEPDGHGGSAGVPMNNDGEDGSDGTAPPALEPIQEWNLSYSRSAGASVTCPQPQAPASRPQTAHGGGGGAATQFEFLDDPVYFAVSGGGGGEAGHWGEGGQNGSPSIGLMMLDSTQDIFEADVTIDGGQGGDGAEGGDGSDGRRGGSGANTGQGVVSGDGGDGSGGSSGPGGIGGASIGVFRVNTALESNWADYVGFNTASAGQNGTAGTPGEPYSLDSGADSGNEGLGTQSLPDGLECDSYRIDNSLGSSFNISVGPDYDSNPGVDCQNY